MLLFQQHLNSGHVSGALWSSEKGPELQNAWGGCGERTSQVTSIETAFRCKNASGHSHHAGTEAFTLIPKYSCSRIHIPFWFKEKITLEQTLSYWWGTCSQASLPHCPAGVCTRMGPRGLTGPILCTHVEPQGFIWACSLQHVGPQGFIWACPLHMCGAPGLHLGLISAHVWGPRVLLGLPSAHVWGPRASSGLALCTRVGPQGFIWA